MFQTFRGSRPLKKVAQNGFTQAEAMALVAVILLMALLIAPALAKGPQQSGTIRCRSNLGQLTLAWLVYAEDNGGNLALNYISGPRAWVMGAVHNLPGATNQAFLRSGILWPYVKRVETYRCPEDTPIPSQGLLHDRVRTVSMSWRMNGDPVGAFANPTLSLWKNLNSIRKPSPQVAMVFVDEASDPNPSKCSVDDGMFVVRADTANSGFWQNTPGSRHGNFGIVSMADGHVETWKWVEPSTRNLGGIDKVTRPRDRDLERFRRATHEP